MIEILIGMIGSGKSTYARSRAKQGAMIISHDAITEGLHGEYRYEECLKSLYRDIMIRQAKAILLAGRDIIVDRTHLTAESREFWLKFSKTIDIKPLGVKVIAVEFPIWSSGIHALRRFNSDSRGRSYEEWLAVANHHYAQSVAEPLNWRKEGFDDWKYISGNPQ